MGEVGYEARFVVDFFTLPFDLWKVLVQISHHPRQQSGRISSKGDLLKQLIDTG